MGFFNQGQQDQRRVERFVLIFFSIYAVNLMISSIQRGWPLWLAWAIMGTSVAAWVSFLIHYRNFRTRAAFTAVMIEIAVILYAAHVEDLLSVMPTFMFLMLLVAFLGITKLLWTVPLSALFILFYHSVIAGTLTGPEIWNHLLPQLGNLVCMGIVLSVWLKRQGEANKRMSDIIEALVEAEHSKDDFLANVSHEIRTPVNTICGLSEMAMREDDLENIRDEIFDIRDAGRNLVSLVNDILDFSQLQQGTMDLEEEAYNITSTINDVINMAMACKGNKDIELIMDCAVDIPSGLLGDEKKIRRVIMNLVDNAIKFTEKGGVNIVVHARKENYGVNLCVTVQDTGIGIEEEDTEKLFQSFSQMDTRRNRQEGGIGLGLAISRALVTRMGGTITVQSCPGKGSTFRFVLPQKVLQDKPIGYVVNREKLNIATYYDMGQYDVMEIRDAYTRLIVHMVQQLQVRCHVCRNLAELKRRESIEPFTHIFISMEEYQEDEAYFDSLSRQTRVIIVLDRPREKYLSNPYIIRLYKPFFILPVISILNGGIGSEGGKQMVRQGKFIAPGVHVLVVDDNQMNIRVVEGLLKEYQIMVSYVTSGREALEIIENMSYDFVFMDHMMPEMDGVETLHHIRAKVGRYYQTVPVIALTANAAPGSREMFLAEGFDDFLAKPVEVSVLERVLKRNLPEEKLIYLNDREREGARSRKTAGQEVSVRPSDGGPEREELAVGDLDVQQGLLYCGSREKYLDILRACLSESEGSRQMLEQLYEKEDWDNYTIKVHALKSTMRSIGAMPLSEKAKALEKAGKREDITFIRKHHGSMLVEYRRVMEELGQCPLLLPWRYEGDVLPAEEGVTQSDRDGMLVRGVTQSERNVLPAGDGDESAGHEELPEADEAAFDQWITDLEDAMYDFDEARMLAILSEMQRYQYGGAALRGELEPVKEKVENTDYMSAVDAVSHIRDRLKHGEEGGAS